MKDINKNINNIIKLTDSLKQTKKSLAFPLPVLLSDEEIIFLRTILTKIEFKDPQNTELADSILDKLPRDVL